MPVAAAAPLPTKRRQASEARRRAILDAAFEIFIAEGFKAARLDDIARGADASAEVARRLWAGLRCAVVDHGTFGWLPETQHALWHLAPHQWHVVGWGVHRPRST